MLIPLLIFILYPCSATKLHKHPEDCFATPLLQSVSREFAQSLSVHIGPIVSNASIDGKIRGEKSSSCEFTIAFRNFEGGLERVIEDNKYSNGKCHDGKLNQIWKSEKTWDEIQFHLIPIELGYGLKIITPDQTTVSEKIIGLSPPFSLEMALGSDDNKYMIYFNCQTDCQINPMGLEDLDGRTVFYIRRDSKFSGVNVHLHGAVKDTVHLLQTELFPAVNHWYKIAVVGKEQMIKVLIDGLLVKEIPTFEMAPYPKIRKVVLHGSAVASWCPPYQSNITSDMIVAWSVSPLLLLFTIIMGILLAINKKEEIRVKKERQALEPITEMKQTPYFFIQEKTPPPLPPPVNPNKQNNSEVVMAGIYGQPFDSLPDDYTLLPCEDGTGAYGIKQVADQPYDKLQHLTTSKSSHYDHLCTTAIHAEVGVNANGIIQVPEQPYDKLQHLSAKCESTHYDDLHSSAHAELSDTAFKDFSTKDATPVAFIKHEISEKSPYAVLSSSSK